MNIFVRLAKKNKEFVSEKSWLELYEALVEEKIRKRYTVNQELAILRQRDTKTAEFAEYNAYAEKCKAEAKAELGM